MLLYIIRYNEFYLTHIINEYQSYCKSTFGQQYSTANIPAVSRVPFFCYRKMQSIADVLWLLFLRYAIHYNPLLALHRPFIGLTPAFYRPYISLL